MRKLLFILVALFAWGISTYAQDFIRGMEIVLYKDIKKDNNTDPEDMPQTRGPIFQPVHAYLHNKAISLSFDEIMQAVTIKIIRESTGETVYSQEYTTGSTIVSINLNSQSPGAYHIEVISKEDILQGDFNL